jgi:maltooligosyltrehalose trehalohydrolase
VAACVWAPGVKLVEWVCAESGRAVSLALEEDGYHGGLIEGIVAGAKYRYRLDGRGPFPDPASRFQPEGPHGPSEVIDPADFRWSDQAWRGAQATGQVLYELHVGTFTPEGTWEAAARELPELARLGVTMIEVMPVADFPGTFGWGYDGVNLFAPSRLYGRPDDFRRFVDRAHAAGIAVILDVVYNHFGPDGNYVREFSPRYFSQVKNDWGDSLNFDGEQSGPVRDYFTANAAYWIEEFHLDGLRLDATQSIHDTSPEHILARIGRAARAAAGEKSIYLVAENEPQEARLIRPLDQQGYGLDALWNDDWHHTAIVALTGFRDAYYNDYLGSPQEFVSAAKHGFLFQGQRYTWQKNRRGTPALDLPPTSFVHFIENHDQVANSGHGRRVHQLTSPGRYRAMTALLLFSPGTPLLFQGQEFASTKPFLFFADHEPKLAALVYRGRKEFFQQFRSLATPEAQAAIPDPAACETFERCRLDFAEREAHAESYRLHRDLLAMRREVLALAGTPLPRFDGAVLGEQAFLLRYFAADGMDRLLVVNLGRDLLLDPAPEPLLAPPADCRWGEAWSSDDPAYGGAGTAQVETDEGWRLPGEAAVLLAPRPREPENPA